MSFNSYYYYMKLKTNLSKILGDKRITQTDLVKRANLNTRTINFIYHDKWGRIARETIIKLCEALDITPGELFELVPGEKGDIAVRAKSTKKRRSSWK